MCRKSPRLRFQALRGSGRGDLGAVTKALEIRQLDIGSEIAPGVPWCFARTAGHEVAITLKSGNFGGEGFFTDALERLGT